MVAWVSVLHRSLTSGQHTFPKGLFVVGLYIGVYLLPVAGMAMYHTRLLLANISTNEQMNFRRYRYFWVEEEDRGDGQDEDEENKTSTVRRNFVNPFDQGRIRNVLSKLVPDRSCYVLGGNNKNGDADNDPSRLAFTNDDEDNDDDAERQAMLRNVV